MYHADLPQRLANLLQRHRASGEAQYSDITPSDQIDGLIIVDRSVDWVTPMCTQLTYQGMLDEYIGIKNGQTSPILILVKADDLQDMWK